MYILILYNKTHIFYYFILVNTSKEIYSEIILNKVQSVKEKLSQEHANYRKLKRKKMIEEQDKFNTFVDRVVTKEKKRQSKLKKSMK